MINGNDGGCNITYDNGEHWFFANTPPVAQFYSVVTDYEASATMTVGAVSAPVITPPAAAGGGGGGGGGALGLQWLLLLAGAIAALRAPRHR